MKEYIKFYAASDKEQALIHLNEAIGNLRQAEEQHPDAELKQKIRDVRKSIEGNIAANQLGGFRDDEIQKLGVEALKYLSEHPEMCPTCEYTNGGVHGMDEKKSMFHVR